MLNQSLTVNKTDDGITADLSITYGASKIALQVDVKKADIEWIEAAGGVDLQQAGKDLIAKIQAELA